MAMEYHMIENFFERIGTYRNLKLSLFIKKESLEDFFCKSEETFWIISDGNRN